MDRRSFLQKSAVFVPVSFLGRDVVGDFKPSPLVEPSDFDSNGEYGNLMRVLGTFPKEKYTKKELLSIDRAKMILWQDMTKVVPAQYRYRVEFRGKKEEGQWAICWYYCTYNCVPTFNKERDYYLL